MLCPPDGLTPNYKQTIMLRYIGLILLLLAGLRVGAQPPPGDDDWMNRSERVRAQRVAYLTQRLQLTTTEAQQFWPVFTEYENARRELTRRLRPGGREEELTEAQAEDFLDQQLELEAQLLELRREYVAKFRQILPAKKVVMLPRADREFKRELLQRLRDRRRNR